MKFQSALQFWIAGAAASLGPIWVTAKEEERWAWKILRKNAYHIIERILGKESNVNHGPVTRVVWDGKRMIPVEDDGAKTIPQSTQTADKDTGGTGRLLNRKQTNRRTNGRKRKIKGSKQNGLPKEAKGSKDTLKIIRKKPKGSKGEAVEETLCFRGSYQDVAAACQKYNAGCCQGSEACLWNNDPSRPTTICQGSCVGDGACKGIGPGSYMSENSCKGEYSCYYLAGNSTQKTPATVGLGACDGEISCLGICLFSKTCQVDIGDISCIGSAACNAIGFYSPVLKDVKIASNACRDSFSCYVIGNENRMLQEVDISSGACQMQQSCTIMGNRGTGASISLGMSACNSAYSCERMGIEAGDISVADMACTDYMACSKLGYSAQGTIQIGKGGCYKPSSCELLGPFANDISIAQEACFGDNACNKLAYSSNADVYLGLRCCEFNDACRYLGESTSYSVSVGEYSCLGSNACSALGRSVTDASVEVELRACDTPGTSYICSGLKDGVGLTTYFIPKFAQTCLSS